jgi:hypothetical protein
MEAKQKPFDAAEANKLIRAQGAKLAEESTKLAHEQWVADRIKYKDGYVSDVKFKRPSQELMDQIQKRNEDEKRRDKKKRDEAYQSSVQRLLKGVKGGRRTNRHRRSGHNKRSGRMSRRR